MKKRITLSLLAVVSVILLMRLGDPANNSPLPDKSTTDRAGFSKDLLNADNFSDTPNPFITKIFDQQALAPGFYTFTPSGRTHTYLLDAEGNIVHEWIGGSSIKGRWYYSAVDENLNLYVIDANDYIAKLDKDSNVLWKLTGRFHHDLDFLENGAIAVAERQFRSITFNDNTFDVLEDIITILTTDGKRVKSISLYDLFKDLDEMKQSLQGAANFMLALPKKLPKEDGPADILHLNSIHTLQFSREGFGKRGDLLISLNKLQGKLATINISTNQRIWHGSPLPGIDIIHDPTQTAPETILFFDNGTRHNEHGIDPEATRPFSRVLEIDPLTNKVVWEYYGGTRHQFKSPYRGRVKRLSNGNTLISVSDAGEAIEVTPQQTLVMTLKNSAKMTSSEIQHVPLDSGRAAQKKNPVPPKKWLGRFSVTRPVDSVRDFEHTYHSIDFDWHFFNPVFPLSFAAEEQQEIASKTYYTALFSTCIKADHKAIYNFDFITSHPATLSLGTVPFREVDGSPDTYSLSVELDEQPSLFTITAADRNGDRTTMLLDFQKLKNNSLKMFLPEVHADQLLCAEFP